MSPSAQTSGRLRRVAIVLLVLALLLLLVGWLSVRALTRDPRPHFAARYTPVALVERSAIEREADFLLQDARLTTTGGLTVDLTVKRPADDTLASAPRPVVLLLGGHRTGRDAARLIEDTRGTVVVALSYPFHGNERAKGLAVVREVRRARAAILDTPPAVRVALDWLETQPWADARRVDIVGVSFGAAFAVIAGALDERIGRVWAIHGAGDPYLQLRTNIAPYVPTAPLQSLAAGLTHVIINGPQLAPERWAPALAPRPLIMVNATEDQRMPREAVLALYESAVGPRELIWLEGGHVNSRSRDLIRALVDTVFLRMQRLDAPEREPEHVPGSPLWHADDVASTTAATAGA